MIRPTPPMTRTTPPPKAERLTPTKRLAAVTLAWCLLLLALYVQGRAPKGTLIPAIGEFYYALEAAFLPAIVFLQWRLGCAAFRRAAVRRAVLSCTDLSSNTLPSDTVANALFVSASCFVLPDWVLVAASRSDLLAVWARVAGPLALFAMVVVLHRATRTWPVTLSTALALALPALLFVR